MLCLIASGLAGSSATPAGKLRTFLDRHCVECHEADVKKGGLDLASARFEPDDAESHALWVRIHDRVADGEMPPPKKSRPEPGEQRSFLQALREPLVAADLAREKREGRATWRRLNRHEYQEALRDLLGAPWLQLKEMLPEDGIAHRFNKSSAALDVSHVQMSRYLGAADHALRQVIAAQVAQPATRTNRHYARDQRSFTGPMKFSVFNTAPERATFPVLGNQAQPAVRAGDAPLTVGSTNAELRELEGVGVVASAYEPIEPKFNNFKAPVAGRYRLRLLAHSVWVGPGPTNKWFIANLDDISPGRRSEPVSIYSESPPRLLRWLGKFDVSPEPVPHELEVWLLAGETIRPDAARLFRSRPGASRWQNPLAEPDGQPGVVFRWLEVVGPIHETLPSPGHRLLFGNLPVRVTEANHSATQPASKTATTTATTATGRDSAKATNGPARGPDDTGNRRPRREPTPGPPVVEVVSEHPTRDAAARLAEFVRAAYRRPVSDAEARRFLPVIRKALDAGHSFTDALLAGYTAVLCSPEFLYLEEKPGRLDDFALATRLSLFLGNSVPDAELRRHADRRDLQRPEVLRAEAERLLNHPGSRRFVEAFLDYWLDLRKAEATSPDASLYPDYYLDDLLVESAVEETRLFFAELLRADLPARHLISSDFAMVNERLAAHYGLPAVEGVAHRRVPLPPESRRGGLLTQASVLKVTANGTTTSPVTRGTWIMERILGQAVPPPPASVPAIEPDIRGAATVRQQLEKHRTLESCNVCHVKIDPTGFALENFDILGGWRDRYRSLGEGKPEVGLAKSGQKFEFHYGLPVDAAGQLPDGRAFRDVRELERLLLSDERAIARNLVRQLVVYATGAPVRFGDRPEVERILDEAEGRQYGVRTLVHALVSSRLFLHK